MRKKKYLSLKGKMNEALLIVLLVVIVFSVLLVVGNNRLSRIDDEVVWDAYQCCDSGDGAACQPSPVNTITYQNEPYGLIKTNIKFVEQARHLVDTGVVIPGKGRVIINDSNHSTTEYHNPPCTVDGPLGPNTRDLIGVYDDVNKQQVWCDNIADEEIIYVCNGDFNSCTSGTGSGEADAYFRLRDLQENSGYVPAAISTCRKPDLALSPGPQQVVLPTYPNPGKKNLQLETFGITHGEPKSEWLSPYCKPAVYLYPPQTMFVHVRIAPHGPLTYTLPPYPVGGWIVLAHPGGNLVYKNNLYDYLYYETQLSDKQLALPDEGFVVQTSDIETFLPELVMKLGLNKRETSAFSEYWLHALPKAQYYQVKIVSQQTLDTLAPLFVTPQPDSLIRVTLHFAAFDQPPASLPEPSIAPMQRKGFSVVEWGGIFKKDKDHDFSCFM